MGPYRQNDGWGNQAKGYVKSLNTTTNDIVIRPVYYGGALDGDVGNDSLLMELEDKDSKDCDIVIQNALPQYFEYNGSFKKNIGMMLTETKGLDYLNWPAYMNLMDEIWVPSKQCVMNIDPNLDSEALGNRTRVPVKNIPSPIDTSIFEKKCGKIEGIDTNLFNFYYIGEFTERKNLKGLLTAFHLEFDPIEPVGLVIKSNAFGSRSVLPEIQNLSMEVKKRLRIYQSIDFYKRESIIAARLSDEEMLSLHNTCDCFVFPSHGESCCRPALTAMGFGKTPIVTSNTGMTDFIDESTGWEIESYEDVVDCGSSPLPGLYSGRETWRNINVKSLMSKMREAYENAELRKEKAKTGMKRIFQHSYESVVKKIGDLLA